MIHIINKILIIIVCILIYLKLFVKEGFQLNKYNKFPVPNVKKIGHLPDNIVNWIGEKIGAPTDPHNADYNENEDNENEDNTCPA